MRKSIEPLLNWLRRSLPYVCLGGVVAIVYGLTMPPSLAWEHWGTDGGDFVVAAVTGRVPHPPGFPLYSHLVRGLVTVLDGDPARLLSAWSGMMGVGATLLVAATLRRRGASWPVATAASMAMAFASWFWSQAVIVEVYTTAAFFGALVIYVGERVSLSSYEAWWGVGVILGLAISVHLTTVFLVVYVLSWRGVRVSALTLGLALGLVPYALLPLRGPWPQPWGDLRSLLGWGEFVSARLYWGNAFSLPLIQWPSRMLAYVVLLSRQFTPLGFLAAMAGTIHMWKEGPGRACGLALSMFGISLYAIGYNTADSWVYLVPYMPLLAMAVGIGLHWAVGVGMPPKVGLIAPLALMLLNWTQVDLGRNREALVWLDSVLEQLPTGAVVLSSEDRDTFTLWYATDGLGRRSDLLIIDERMWGFESYREYIRSRSESSAEQPGELARNRPLCKVAGDHEVICE